MRHMHEEKHSIWKTFECNGTYTKTNRPHKWIIQSLPDIGGVQSTKTLIRVVMDNGHWGPTTWGEPGSTHF